MRWSLNSNKIYRIKIYMENSFGLMKKKIALLISFFFLENASGIGLKEVLTQGYQKDPQMLLIRRSFLEEVEAFPQALAQFMPKASASIASSDSRGKIIGQYGGGPSSSQKSLAKTITLEQPVFNGGGSVASLKAAQSTFRTSRASYYSNEQKVILNQIKIFAGLYSARAKYENALVSVKQNETQLEAVEAQVNVGEATVTDLAAAKTKLAMARTKLANAFANLEASKATFSATFDMDSEISLELPDTSSSPDSSLEEISSKIAYANYDFQAAKNSLDASKSKEYSSKAEILPSVAFRMQAARNYFDPETNNSVNGLNVTSSLVLNIPILASGGIEYSRIRLAKNNTRKAVLQLDSTIKKNKSDAISIYEGFKAAKEANIAAEQAVEAAQIAYDGMIQQQSVGTKTILDVLQAESDLSSAKDQKVDAIVQNLLVFYQMKSLTGDLTAKSFNLKVDYFVPEKEFRKVKFKIIGS